MDNEVYEQRYNSNNIFAFNYERTGDLQHRHSKGKNSQSIDVTLSRFYLRN